MARTMENAMTDQDGISDLRDSTEGLEDSLSGAANMAAILRVLGSVIMRD